ncbi:MAG: hypothetical protein JWM04_1131, partial [Verrucomicrobiales bacterium]|nr:hypothetical protein [Verrucomicrobiales bacterium]
SVLIAIGSHRFLITAAHVLDGARGNPVYIGLQRGYIEISGVGKNTAASHGNRNDDRVDVAFISLDTVFADAAAENYAFLPIQFVDVQDNGADGTPYVVNGCPSKKVKREGRTFYPSTYELKITGRTHDDYDGFGISPFTHIAMEFDRSKMTDGHGRRVHSPKLSGVSGGPVWKFIQTKTADGQAAFTRRLVGITIEHYESRRTLVGTRIAAALAMIRTGFPDIAHIIPESPTLDIRCRDSNETVQ